MPLHRRPAWRITEAVTTAILEVPRTTTDIDSSEQQREALTKRLVAALR
jgi:hypothetical protein